MSRSGSMNWMDIARLRVDNQDMENAFDATILYSWTFRQDPSNPGYYQCINFFGEHIGTGLSRALAARDAYRRLGRPSLASPAGCPKCPHPQHGLCKCRHCECPQSISEAEARKL